MARTKGMLNLSGNLEVNAGAPLDARSVVPTVADLTIASNFQYKYVGMTVTVQATGDMYTLLSNDVTDIANWKPVGKTYTAGTNVNISDQNVISATDTTYTAGTGIDITNGVISATGGGGSSYTAGDGIVISNDEISVDEMASADMSEIIDPLPSVEFHLHTYSTSAQKIGTWTNGKAIYEIVGALPTGATELYSFSMGGSTVRWYTID